MKHFKNYTPITATPFRHSETYVEIEPCAALKPYIRCFWGSKDIYTQDAGVAAENVVVPGGFGFHGRCGGDSFTARRPADAGACAGYSCE